MTRHPRRDGFSLLEISIVLVVIALLAGGIMAGKNLIRAAELRNVNLELEKFRSAVVTYKERYSALPGDHGTAEQVWGAAANCNTASTVFETGVCNGNGDGYVDAVDWSGGCSASHNAVNIREGFQFWKHLASAGLIEGQYTGVRATNDGAGAPAMVQGVNLPGSLAGNNLAWRSQFKDACDADTWRRPDQGQVLVLGQITKAGSNPTDVAATGQITPEEAWSLDAKLDDGKPGTGAMRVKLLDAAGDAAFCADSDDAGDFATAEYNLRPAADVTPKCALYFPNVFF